MGASGGHRGLGRRPVPLTVGEPVRELLDLELAGDDSSMPGNPYLVRWTAHALAKVEILGIDRAEIERAILEYDHVRRQNPGAASWRINAGRLVIVYQHPDQGDRSAARVVTVWRKR